MKRIVKRLVPLALVAALGVAACSSSSKSNTSSTTAATTPPATSTTPVTGNPTSAVTLNESGSTLLYPFLQELVDPLHSAFANITLNPGPGGSGKGISDAIAGTTQIGGSDAYLSPSQLSSNPGLMNIPIVISAQAVNYNLPGISNLKLSGDIIAKMYEGKISKWNDPAIAALNSGVSLPATTVVPVRRIDSSGDTFIFTSFLSATNTEWQNGPAFGTTVTWPAAPGELTANGNPGMVQTCHATAGCIAYIGVSAEAQAQSAGLGEVMLQNKDGNFVQPAQANIEAAVSAGSGNVPDNLAAPLIFEPGAQSYPIVNFEYIIVKSQQSSSDLAMAIRTFLAWAMDPNGGSTTSYLAEEDFVALPSSVVPKVQAAIAKITG
ncbi:MAG TPA: phosphate ABC transporter substrate-binding protein PstS [Acidimicrobiales bacterium]|nr:phosphate ABC transporter substrate-binding protein PstS [Acidimicrobiales bacterium]